MGFMRAIVVVGSVCFFSLASFSLLLIEIEEIEEKAEGKVEKK